MRRHARVEEEEKKKQSREVRGIVGPLAALVTRSGRWLDSRRHIVVIEIVLGVMRRG
jgi:hypothetical protein